MYKNLYEKIVIQQFNNMIIWQIVQYTLKAH